MARGAELGEPGRWRAVTQGRIRTGLRPIMAVTRVAVAFLREIPTGLRRIDGAGPSLFRRTYFSPPSLGTQDGVPVMSDDDLMVAETNNRRVALVRIEQGHWGTPPGLIDIFNEVPDDHVDAVEAEVHGNANYGNQGEVRQAYEVLAYANELVRYGRPFQDFHMRLYAWALLFPVHQMETFEVASNNFGHFRRAWTEAVFLSRRMAKELSVPFAEEAGMEEYLDELIEVSRYLTRRNTPWRRSLTRAPWR